MPKRPSSSQRKTSQSAVHKKRAEEAAPFLDGIRYIMELKGFKETARNIFDQCKKFVGADGGYVGLLTEDGKEIHLLFLDAGRRPCMVDTERPMPIRGLREQAIRSRKAVFYNDFPASEWQGILPEGHVRLDNVLFAPLITQGKVIGLLGLGNKPGGFDEQDARTVTTFADLAAIALHNSQTLEALEKSEERFRAVAQSATDAVISINQHGEVIFWNAAAQTIFGWAADEMIGKPLERICPERFRADHRAGIERVASTGEARLIGKTAECIGLRRDGSEFPIELSLSKWQTREGIFFTGIVRDITERKRAEEEYRTIISTAMDGFWITDTQGRFLDVNDAYCHLTGYSREELLKMRIQDVEAAEKPEETARHIQKVMEIGYDRFETLHRCKDGRVIAVEASANYMPGDSGRFFVFLRDITERMQAEEALQKAHDELERQVQERTAELAKANEALKADITERKRAEEQLRKLSHAVEQSPASVVITDTHGDIEYVNPKFTEITGYTPEEVIGQNPRILKTSQTPPEIYAALWKSITSGKVWRGELCNRKKNGDLIWESTSIAPVFDASGRITHFTAVKEDVTERKRTEEREHSRNHILTSITTGEPLAAILELIARSVEAENPEAICSILLLDKEGQHLLNGAAPNLPDFYNQAIHGLKIGNGVGSCGTAAFTKQRVIAEDVLTHPYWVKFRELAQKANLRSCWSEPILSTAGKVLGTFAIYHHEPRSPSSEDIERIKLAADFASLAIERKQAEEEILRENDTRTALNTLLRLSLEDVPLDELLAQALDLTLSIPWLAFESSGAILLAEDDQVLVLKNQRGLAEPIQRACARVPFGKCLCGRAAAEQKIMFADCLDVRHEITYEGIRPHGHYCVPILSAGKTLGVINVYLLEGHHRDIQEEKFLLAIADTLAGSIERKRAEVALRESETKYRIVADNTYDWEFWVDPEGQYIYTSPSCERITGYTADKFMADANLLDRIIHPDDLPGYVRHRREVAEPPAPGEVEFRVLRPDGTWRWIEHACQPVFDDKGRFQGTRGSNRDITGRKGAEEKIEQQLARLKSLNTINTAILSTTDLRLALKAILEEAKSQLRADIAAIMLLDPHTLMLEFAANIGYRIPATARFRVRMGEGIAGKAALERRTIAVPDLAEAELSAPAKEMAAAEGTRSIYATPLIVKGQVVGVMTILFRTPFHADQDWLDFFETLAGQIAIAIDSIRSFESLQRGNIDLMLAYDATIEGWSHAMDLRDKETEGHTLRVTELTERLARTMGMSEAEIIHVRRGALLHDMGKMGIPDAILLKPDKLTDEEWVVMRRHPQFAFEMLSPITYLRPALDIPYCHHEKWDGTGYPRGLKGEQIPLAARIFAIVDVWDALMSDRPYRKAWSREKTLEHIKTNSGTHFDPKVVEAFIRLQQESKTSN